MRLFPLLALLIALCVSGSAAPITFSDPYAGNNPGSAGSNGDVLGQLAQFDIEKIVFTNVTNSNVMIDIYFNYNYGDTSLSSFAAGSVTLNVGDLIFYKAGAPVYAVALKSHGSLTGGSLYTINDALTSAEVIGNVSGDYRPNADVWANSTGATKVGNGTSTTVSNGGVEVKTTLSFTPSSQFFSDFNNLSFSFASATCGNDILSGDLSPVPEPGTFMLLGIGLVGFAMIRRKVA